jgi:RNA 3'-terminal phosphate cyclase (ATP)
VLATRPAELRRLELTEVGEVVARKATAVVARLPTHVAERELAAVRAQLGWEARECEIRDVPAAGPGNALLLYAERAGGGRELVTGLGERGTRAELVASRACDELAAWLAAEVPVGEHLADQLLLPMALGAGGRFRCAEPSLHTTTNIDTLAAFLPARRPSARADGASWIIEVPPP